MGFIVLLLVAYGLYSLYIWWVKGLSDDLANIIGAIIQSNKHR